MKWWDIIPPYEIITCFSPSPILSPPESYKVQMFDLRLFRSVSTLGRRGVV